MTKEQQLDWLCRLRSEIYVYMPQEWIKKMDEALTQSIKALEQEPCNHEEKPHSLLDAYFQMRAEQEPCEDCDYSEIMDWEQDAKTGKAKPIYWCERHKEPCDDVVSRQAVKEIITDIRDCISVEGYCAILERMKKLPPVRPQEPKTGHWIEVEVRNCHATLKCSECDRVIEPTYTFGEYSYEDIKKFYPYCHCGAKMVEPQESEV